jgi:DNA-binding NarL/FixJ family response regulator
MLILLHTTAPVLARGFEALTAEHDDLEAVSIDGDIPQLIRTVEERSPEVVLLDTPDQVDFGVITQLGRNFPECPLVLWVFQLSVEMAHHAKAMGVRGVVRKEVADQFLVRCLRQVAAGDIWFDRALLNSMLQVREVRLSPRERQLMRLIAQGLSNKEVASQLMISEGTVKVYLAKLFRKVGVHDRYELAMHGLRSLGLAASQPDGAAAGPGAFTSSLILTEAPHRGYSN